MRVGTVGVPQPAMFIGGRRDPAVLFGKLEPMEAAVPEPAPDRTAARMRPLGMQQERPGDVNDELLDFLGRDQGS